MLSIMNYLAEHFNTGRKKFKFYCIIKGEKVGMFQTWIEVVDAIKNFKGALYKGFHDYREAFEFARKQLGKEFYITPSLRNYIEPPQIQVVQDMDNLHPILCTHCEKMGEVVKKLNDNI